MSRQHSIQCSHREKPMKAKHICKKFPKFAIIGIKQPIFVSPATREFEP